MLQCCSVVSDCRLMLLQLVLALPCSVLAGSREDYPVNRCPNTQVSEDWKMFCRLMTVWAGAPAPDLSCLVGFLSPGLSFIQRTLCSQGAGQTYISDVIRTCDNNHKSY